MTTHQPDRPAGENRCPVCDGGQTVLAHEKSFRLTTSRQRQCLNCGSLWIPPGSWWTPTLLGAGLTLYPSWMLLRGLGVWLTAEAGVINLWGSLLALLALLCGVLLLRRGIRLFKADSGRPQITKAGWSRTETVPPGLAQDMTSPGSSQPGQPPPEAMAGLPKPVQKKRRLTGDEWTERIGPIFAFLVLGLLIFTGNTPKDESGRPMKPRFFGRGRFIWERDDSRFPQTQPFRLTPEMMQKIQQSTPNPPAQPDAVQPPPKGNPFARQRTARYWEQVVHPLAAVLALEVPEPVPLQEETTAAFILRATSVEWYPTLRQASQDHAGVDPELHRLVSSLIEVNRDVHLEVRGVALEQFSSQLNGPATNTAREAEAFWMDMRAAADPFEGKGILEMALIRTTSPPSPAIERRLTKVVQLLERQSELAQGVIAHRDTLRQRYPPSLFLLPGESDPLLELLTPTAE